MCSHQRQYATTLNDHSHRLAQNIQEYQSPNYHEMAGRRMDSNYKQQLLEFLKSWPRMVEKMLWWWNENIMEMLQKNCPYKRSRSHPRGRFHHSQGRRYKRADGRYTSAMSYIGDTRQCYTSMCYSFPKVK